MKLTVDTLDNSVKSAVINIGKNNGYVEAFINVDEVCINVYGKHGDIVSQQFIPLAGILAERLAGQAATPVVLAFTSAYIAAWLGLSWMGMAA